MISCISADRALPIGENLLLTHQNDPKPGFISGGGIDPGEHPIPALHREVMEETGWIIERPRRVGVKGSCICQSMIFGQKSCVPFFSSSGDASRPYRRGAFRFIVSATLAVDWWKTLEIGGSSWI